MLRRFEGLVNCTIYQFTLAVVRGPPRHVSRYTVVSLPIRVRIVAWVVLASVVVASVVVAWLNSVACLSVAYVFIACLYVACWTRYLGGNVTWVGSAKPWLHPLAELDLHGRGEYDYGVVSSWPRLNKLFLLQRKYST